MTAKVFEAALGMILVRFPCHSTYCGLRLATLCARGLSSTPLNLEASHEPASSLV